VRKVIVFIAVALVFGVVAARAQEQSRRALAEELINVMDARSLLERNLDLIKQMIQTQAGQMNQITGRPGASPDASQTSEKMFELVSQYLNWDRIKGDFISVYSETYTEDEMKGIIAFYQSPAGQAFLKKQPQLMQRTIEVSQKWMKDILPKIQELAKQPPK